MTDLLDPVHDLEDVVVPCGHIAEVDLDAEHTAMVPCGAPATDLDNDLCDEHAEWVY